MYFPIFHLAIVGLWRILFQTEPPEDLTNLLAVLTWLATAGGAAFLAGYVISLIAELIPQWHDLPDIAKRLIPMVLAIAIAFGARLLLIQVELLAVLAPIYQIIVAVILAWLGQIKALTYANSSGLNKHAKARSAKYSAHMAAGKRS